MVRLSTLIALLACTFIEVAEAAKAAKSALPPGMPSNKASGSSTPDPPSSSRKKVISAQSIAVSEAILQKPIAPNSFRAETLARDEAADTDGDIVPESVVTISPAKAAALGLEDDTHVLLRGKKRRYSCALLRVAAAKGKGAVSDEACRASPHVLGNLRARDSEFITITAPASPLREAKSVTLAPYSEDIEGSGLTEAELIGGHVRLFFAKNPSVHLDDAFTVTHAGRSVQFRVTGIDAGARDKKRSAEEVVQAQAHSSLDRDGDACLVGKGTQITCSVDDALLRSQDPERNEVGYDDIGGCRAQMAAIRELVELPLRHPYLFTKVRLG